MNMCSLSKAQLTQIRLLDAVEHLAETVPLSEITLRVIAQEADCSLGLAYRYFESKERLLGAVLDRAAAHIVQDLTYDDSLERLVEKVWQRMAERPAFGRLYAWLSLEGYDVTHLMSDHPLEPYLAFQAEAAGDPDPTSAAAAASAIVLAGGVFGPSMNRAAGRQPEDGLIYARLAEAVKATPTASGHSSGGR